VITPRRTRLIRVGDLHAFRRVIGVLCDRHAAVVVVPNRAAARQIARTAARRTLDGALFLTRDELYEELNSRLEAPRRLTSFERDSIAQAAALDAATAVPDLPFRVRPGLVTEMLKFYDQMRRQSQTVERFAELIEETIGGDTTGDRGAERMLRQTRFIERALSSYEERVRTSGGWDEHLLRARLIDVPVNPPLRHIVVTVGDWIADPDGLFVADFDLLARMPAVETIDIVCTEATLGSGFHQRLHEWLPGLEETTEVEIAGARLPERPVLSVPVGAPPEQPWFVRRDREEELIAVARMYSGPEGQNGGPKGPPYNSDGGQVRLPFDEDPRVAVVYKRPLPYLYLAPATLGAAAIDYETADALPLAAEPSAAAVDLILDAVETSFSRESLVAILRSAHFRDIESPLPAASVSALDRGLSDKRYLGDLGRLAQLVAEWPADEARDAAAAALEIGRRLSRLAERAPASASLQLLASLLGELWKPIANRDPFASRERRARGAVADVIEALRAAHAAHHDPEWTFPDLAGAVRRAIEASTFAADEPARQPNRSKVSLVDDQAARYGSFEHLIVVGLIENEWPEAGVRNIFYPPLLLKALGWPSEKERRAAAEARFLDLLGSASRSVALSTITLDDEAIVSRSSLLDEIARARLSTVAEEGTVNELVFDDDALLKELPDLEHLGPKPRQWAALRMSRPSADRPEFHGVANPERVGLPHAGSRPARVWSVSGVETYLECPFKFFARHVLALEEEPEDEEVMDPRRQGQFVHAVFEDFFRAWQESGRGAITPDNLDDARRMFETIVDRQLEEATFSDAEAGLERTRLLGSPAASGLGEAVFRMEAERPVAVVERLLEYSVNGELTVSTSTGARTVSLRGKADRLDLLEDGTFRLIDYKLGWPPDRARALQLPMYALFAEQRLQSHRGRRYVLGEAAYLAFKGPKRVVPLFTSPAQRADVMSKAQERLSAALDAIGRGEFPPTPDDVYRCESCSFAAVCRKDYVDS
jgi:RecB family exonuclease